MNNNTMPDNNTNTNNNDNNNMTIITFFMKPIHTISCYRYCGRVIFGLKVRTILALLIAPSKVRDRDIDN